MGDLGRFRYEKRDYNLNIGVSRDGWGMRVGGSAQPFGGFLEVIGEVS